MDSVYMNILNIISQIAGICSTTSTFLCQITCDQNVSVKPDTAVLLNQKLQQKDLLLKITYLQKYFQLQLEKKISELHPIYSEF